ncbi:MAG TPA: MFS transporter [Rickettsiales bacterium]|nr:MFS transporter [Rickettsiales bacterium]
MFRLNSSSKISLLILSVFSYFVVVGLSAVVLPLILKFNNVSDFFIGFSDNVKVIAGLGILIILPRIASKFGIVGTGVLSLAFFGLSILLLPLYCNYFIWLILMFLFGAGFIVFRTMEESLTNVIVNNKIRGKIMGYIATAMLAGLAIGPLLPKIFGVMNYINFIISFVLIFISAVCFLMLKQSQGYVKPTANFQLFRFIKEMPLVFFSKFIMEFIIQVVFVFLVIYVIETTNYSAENAGLFITYFSLSGLLNIFVGRFIDKFTNKNVLMVFGVFVLFVCLALLPLTLKFNIISSYILFFIFGLFGSGLVFLSSMYILNSSYQKKDLVSANSALTFSDAIAMISGSFFTGISMEIFGAKGFFVPILVLSVLYIIFCLCYFHTNIVVLLKKVYKNGK